jgi:hypothetical protein
LLSYHNQELIFDHFVKIRKQSALEEAEEPDPQPQKRTMTVLKLTERLGLIETGTKVFGNIDWYK